MESDGADTATDTSTTGTITGTGAALFDVVRSNMIVVGIIVVLLFVIAFLLYSPPTWKKTETEKSEDEVDKEDFENLVKKVNDELK